MKVIGWVGGGGGMGSSCTLPPAASQRHPGLRRFLPTATGPMTTQQPSERGLHSPKAANVVRYRVLGALVVPAAEHTAAEVTFLPGLWCKDVTEGLSKKPKTTGQLFSPYSVACRDTVLQPASSVGH